ncbi:hypothetical protein C0991_012106 [Blastosporella zonata]|nr:hypothetical protein C0991_012106 [Blastosporella zonata]
MAPWTGKGKDTRPLSQPTSKPTDTDGNDPAPSDAPRTTEKSFFSKLKNKVKKGNALAPTAEQNTTSAPREQHLAADNVRASHAQHAKDSSLAGVTVKPTDRREALDGLAHAARRSATSALPGEWELDPTFLAALSKWDREHPHNTLNNVLQNVSKAIEKGKPLIGIIPDTPFPAQSLVKGLAQVIQLGAMLSDADLKLQDFALGVAEWLTDLKTQIASLDNEAFAAVAWENLAKADGRWTKLDMEAEIAEFKARVEEARQIFHDRALMTISKHIFVLQNTLENIQKAHKTQDEEIAAEKARRETLHRALDPHTAARPTYDQQGKLPCDAGSRTEVLETIRRWIHDHSDKSQNFLWLTGDPGCGKSAVTTTIAQEGKDGRFLWAQYFINRNLEHTTDPNMYFPTIARQLSDLSNKVERHVHDTVVKAPSVTDQISSGQAVELFIGAIAKASNANPGTPVLIVIDGLDETDKSHLSTTAKIFSQLFEKLSDHRNAKILISSRTEHQIHKPFSAALTSAHVKRIHLDTRDPSCLQDVERFIRGRLHEVAVDHDLDPTLWPGKEREERLNEKAEGLYIWAVTVTKFLDARLRKQGRENPYGVIDQLQLPNKANISVLYQRILQVTYDDDDDDPTEWDLETFRRIVGAIIVAREPLSVAQLDDLLHLSHTPSSRHRVDLRNFVQLLRTVLVSGMESVTGATVVRLHKSFFEYITTNAEERFRIDLEAANAEMALCCLQHVVESHAIVASTQFAHAASDVKTLPYPTRYALRFGLSHVTRRNGQRLGIVLDNPAVTLAQFNAAISCSPHTSPLIISLQNDPSVITTSFHTHALIWDVDNASDDLSIRLWDVATHQQLGESWGPCTHQIWSVSFSPDGSHVLSVSTDGFQLWEVPTGRTLARVRLVEKDLSEIVRGVISPDGQYAVVGLHNGKLAISNISPYTFHIKDTFSAKWSALSIPKGNLFISLGFDNTLFLSRLDSGKFGGRPLPRNNPQVTVHSVLFSPDERYIAGVCEDGEIYLWSAEDYTLIATHRHDLARGIPSLSFTHDSTGIAVNFAMDKYLLTPVENYLMLSNDISSIQEASIRDAACLQQLIQPPSSKRPMVPN